MIKPYICPQCQLKSLDPLSVPLVTLVRPFKVSTLKGALKDRFDMLKYCKKEFNLEDEFH